ncbi:adenosylmethionine--8-amino-7-oxononanoate transaminase [Stratiformator vulcanicus]|uniref:Adenosylmethionine-8-amino-7-oxononanoate aminotransferase n=1 Tax=Stratiformator vulcanicus TaxID=2527980 RepID=A0A517R653_9PLAN|nr:adenosylmethionine--8-amino-7-oxononanoate transaminase [Stratiformator vulcanicus]QDT39349.1 L-Lysine-8-amino-7-oxononanoate aminotransferase [Stratiformator vulcanicus]
MKSAESPPRPDALWHPFTPMQAFSTEDAPIIAAGEGFDLIDDAGRRYLDGISSLWCNVHGHRVPQIDDAVRGQLDRIAHSTLLGLRCDVAEEFAAELVRITPPNLTRVFYSDSGATSVEVALKMAFQYHRQKSSGAERRTTYLRMGDAYHGDTVGTVSVGGIDLFHGVYGDLLFDTVHVPCPAGLHLPEGHDRDSYTRWCFDEARRLVIEHHKNAAAFVIEPLVQGAAGILVHTPGFLKHVRQLTSEYGIPLICDEVAVGFGKTGTMFASEQEEVRPDFMCLAKGITGGYLPLAATLATDEIFEAFLGEPHEGQTFYHGHTYTGNALGCAAGLASLRLFEERDVLANVGELSQAISESLAPLEDHPHVGEIRQKGIMTGIELVADRDGMKPYDAELRMGHRVTLAARKRGVIIRPLGDVIVLMPAVAMPPAQVHRLCEVTVEAINEVTHRPV